MDFKSLISKMDSIAAKKVLLESDEMSVDTSIPETTVTAAPNKLAKENVNSDIYNKLVESFGYIAEADPAAFIRQNPAASFGANNLSGNVPAGDPSPMKPGDTRYNPDYDPNTGKLKTDTDTPAPTDPANNDQNKPKPKPGIKAYPGVRALQHFLNKNGIKIAIDGKFGPETSKATDQMVRQIEALYPKTKYDGSPERAAQYDKWDKMSKEHLNLRQAAIQRGTNNAEAASILTQYGYDPKTGDPVGGKTAAVPAAAAPTKDGEVVKGQGGQADGPPADAPTNEPYWVNGTRYKWSWSDEKRGMAWVPNFKPGDWGMNANQAAAKAGYTGPDSKKSNPQAQGTQIAGAPTGVINKESAELDIIRKLSGM